MLAFIQKHFNWIFGFFLCVAIVIYFNIITIQNDEIDARINALTQERGYSWEQVNGTPDYIYFVSFAGDTTYYDKRIK